MPTRLWVGNVAYNSTQQELEALFLEHGKLANVSYREGFSFIEFENEDDAEAARAAIHDTEFRGRKLAVEFARSEGLRPRGGEGHPVQTLPSGCRHLYVARIPAVSTGEEVREFFAKHGQVLNIKMLPQKGEFRSAFVDFAEPADAASAFETTEQLHGVTLRMDYNQRAGRPSSRSDGPNSGRERDGDYHHRERDGGDSNREREYGYEHRGGDDGGYGRTGGGGGDYYDEHPSRRGYPDARGGGSRGAYPDARGGGYPEPARGGGGYPDPRGGGGGGGYPDSRRAYPDERRGGYPEPVPGYPEPVRGGYPEPRGGSGGYPEPARGGYPDDRRGYPDERGGGGGYPDSRGGGGYPDARGGGYPDARGGYPDSRPAHPDSSRGGGYADHRGRGYEHAPPPAVAPFAPQPRGDPYADERRQAPAQGYADPRGEYSSRGGGYPGGYAPREPPAHYAPDPYAHGRDERGRSGGGRGPYPEQYERAALPPPMAPSRGYDDYAPRR